MWRVPIHAKLSKAKPPATKPNSELSLHSTQLVAHLHFAETLLSTVFA